MFHSEVEPIPILDECCKELQLDMDRRLSGIVVLSYLASQGASLYHRNKKKKVTPLDYIENQHLKEKLQTFLQSLCWFCQEKKATVTLHPCQHTVICQNCCSQMTFKQCPICRQHILQKSGFGRNLGIRNIKLGNIRHDYPFNTEEQGFQMLHTWYTSCDPERRTLKTLRKALEEAECFEALQCLPSEEK
ncbi:ankyrin-3-like isoform X6 [Octopus vulgaris]|uniref:Ankyrin-3-like isoform X6 n=1 Tax=Octopus vulgaris TaxID=6645 RepID=A0AA36FRJ7_OCTVU|nr:ankyrin-3-like isoform X6 [Octopus vulgaris]